MWSQAPARAYLREFGAAMLAYAIVLPLSIVLIQQFPTSPWRFALALAPMLPLVLVLVAVLRFCRRIDELQRRIQLEALAFAFAGAALLTFSYGLLQGIGFPQLNWTWVWPVMAVLWLVGLWLANRRYGCATD